MVRARTERQRGAFLIGVAGALVVIGLTVLAVQAMRHQQRTLNVSIAPAVSLARIDAALAAFVAQHRRLPCPARGTIAAGALNAGRESINLSNGQCTPANQSDGVVPWSTLGLTDTDALDPWGARISYRVQPSLASNLLRLMNMSWCDPAGAPNGATSSSMPCATPCSGSACTHPLNYLYAKGLPVRDAAGAWLNQPAPPWPGAPTPPLPAASGAAYVLIGHGANGAGAYNAAGALQPGTTPPGNNELSNRNGQGLTGAIVFIDASRIERAGTTYFDDTLSHPTLASVLASAALGPRTPH